MADEIESKKQQVIDTHQMSANSRNSAGAALTSRIQSWSVALMLILIFHLSWARALASSNPTESSEPEIRAALCDLEKRDFVNAQKRIEAVLKSDPDNISAQKVFLGILAREIKPGDRSAENIALIKKTIEAYNQALKNSHVRREDKQQIDRYVAFLYGQLGEEELNKELQRRAADSARTPKDRAEVYAILAGNSWNCAYRLTSNGRALNKSEIGSAKACVASGLDYVTRAITLKAENESAWSYKASLFREASTVAELEGNQGQKTSYQQDSDEALKHAIQFADAHRKAEEKESARQEKERKENDSFTVNDAIKASQDLIEFRKENSLDEAVKMIFMSGEMELTTLVAPVPIPEQKTEKTESSISRPEPKECFTEVKGSAQMQEKRAWKSFSPPDRDLTVDLPDNVCSRGGGYIAASEGVIYSIDPLPRPAISSDPTVINAVLNTMARTFVGFRGGVWVSDGPTNGFEIKLLRKEDFSGEKRKTYAYALIGCSERKDGVLIVHASRAHYYTIDISGARDSDPRVQRFWQSLKFK